jgi:hypothetical protein
MVSKTKRVMKGSQTKEKGKKGNKERQARLKGKGTERVAGQKKKESGSREREARLKGRVAEGEKGWPD